MYSAFVPVVLSIMIATCSVGGVVPTSDRGGQANKAQGDRLSSLQSEILSISKGDTDVVKRLSAIFAGRGDVGLTMKRDPFSRLDRRISWWAFGELILHPLSVEQMEFALKRYDDLRLYRADHPQLLRPNLVSKVWTSQRAECMISDLSSDDQSERLRAVVTLRMSLRLGCDPALYQKIGQKVVPLLQAQNERIKYHAWMLASLLALDLRRRQDLLLMELKKPMADWRLPLLSLCFSHYSREIEKAAMSVAKSDLRSKNLDEQRVSFLVLTALPRRKTKNIENDLIGLAWMFATEDDRELQFGAMKYLSSLPPAVLSDEKFGGIQVLSLVLKDPDPYVRLLALRLLIRVFSRSEKRLVLIYLRRCVKDTDTTIRETAGAALKLLDN